MGRVAISTPADVDFGGLVSHLLDVPDAIEKMISRSRNVESKCNIPFDVVETPNEFVMYFDVPGLSKSDIQALDQLRWRLVTVEEENLLMVRSNGKRKREEDKEDEACKYLRLERRPHQNLVRKFRLAENCNASRITAKCENGVLTVVVPKLPPKAKTVEVTVS